MARTFRPGQFGILTVVKPDFDLNATITQALPNLTKLRLKGVEWLELGSGILAVLFSSFQSQIYLSEWQNIFKYIFANSNSDKQLRDNSRKVVKMMADARQQDAMSINHFAVLSLLLSLDYHCDYIFWQWCMCELITHFSFFRSPSTRRVQSAQGLL